MRLSRIAVAVTLLLSALPAAAFDTLDRPLEAPVPYSVDSGWLTNESPSQVVLHHEVVQITGADWVRLYFGDVQLGEGSYLRVTSDLDGEVQVLDAAALAMWSQSTAYFNGDTVHVELVGGPQSQANRLVIEKVAWETYDPGRSIRFRFTAPAGFDGTHAFDVLRADVDRTILRHTIDMRATGLAMVSWPLVYRPLHDALLEDGLDRAELALGRVPRGARWSTWVRLLRSMLGARR